MPHKDTSLLNGLQDLRPLLKKAKVKSPTDTIWKKFPKISRTTVYRCFVGDATHEKMFDIRKMAIKMITENNKKISSEILN